MIDWLSIIFALLVALVIALVETLPVEPDSLSQAELERRAQKGNHDAKTELSRRSLLPLYFGLLRIKVAFLVVVLVGILVAANPLWLALITAFVLLLLVGVVVAKRLLAWPASKILRLVEPLIWKSARVLAPVLRLFAPPMAVGESAAIGSKDELKQLISQDASVLLPEEKAHLIGSVDFGNKKVADAMVPRSKIATVDAVETVGPLLLDRLHKAGHNIFVVVKKDLDNVAGLLYMSDLVSLDEDIKKVKDATRPTVYYIGEDANLGAIIAASLKTGRQLFLVADKQGAVSGLVTLADALEHVFGARLNKDAAIATDPKRLL